MEDWDGGEASSDLILNLEATVVSEHPGKPALVLAGLTLLLLSALITDQPHVTQGGGSPSWLLRRVARASRCSRPRSGPWGGVDIPAG